MALTAEFRAEIDKIFENILVLQQVLEKVDLPSIEALRDLDHDLSSLSNTVTLLSYNVQLGNKNHEDRDWWNVERLEELLKNSNLCLLQFISTLLSGLRPDTESLNDQLPQNLVGEVRHLRMRIAVGTTALSAPVMVSAVESLRPSLGPSFEHLGFRALDDCADELRYIGQYLKGDGRVSSTGPPSPDTPSLHQQRLELARIIEGLSSTLLNARLPSTSDKKQPLIRRRTTRGSARYKTLERTASESDWSSSGMMTPSTDTITPRAGASSKAALSLSTLISQDDDPDVLGLANSMMGLSPFEPQADDAVMVACHSTHHHSPNDGLPAYSQLDPVALQTLSAERVAAHERNTYIDTDALGQRTPDLLATYSTARDLLDLGRGQQALPLLQSLHSSIINLNVKWPLPPILQRLPRRPQVLLDMSRAYLLCVPRQTSDAIALLVAIYKMRDAGMGEKYAAAHSLAQVYWETGDIDNARKFSG
ncbi:hypothetical protein BU24DRAFT_405842 [Aaosphaeria arxii CBS 175.79]|uniref:Uncharacterized protein n=1 Tax=Aaosphaeria arxii CBS 175.79 TaxID=1450172 RepID=A0A6A5Y0Y4_9PLEO|nr:uncharacterized protein BU24DRAFT_405842 [Aaosphaeria arxii CBS 175.79]KAF2019132.1 hypothetical protein BU24DRAFT_405842 [Aaosphaeria arxii CBS 175.79]